MIYFMEKRTNVQKVLRLILALVLGPTSTLLITGNYSAANAVGEITVYSPTINSANFGPTLFNSRVGAYVPIANSRTITITLESDNTVNRIITTNLLSGLQPITFDPLAPDASLLSNSQIVSVLSSLGQSTSYPNGEYKVTFSWQYSLSGVQTRTQDVTHVSFFANCTAGEFAAVSTTGCTQAWRGRYVPSASAFEQISCQAGTYQDELGQSSCKPSRPNHYANTSGLFSDFACPEGYTSPAGSVFDYECIAPLLSGTPAAVKALPTLGKGKKMKIKTLASEIEMTVPAKSKVSAKVATASKKICKVSGSSIKGLKPGACVVTVKVKPKKGTSTTQSTTITVS